MSVGARLSRFVRATRGKFADIRRDTRANVAIMFALVAPVLLGGMGIAVETGNWYYTQRAMQNAADASAIAAATNGTSTYATEADATAASYGFTNGTNSVVVAASNAAPCPAGGSTCYSVTITKPVPLYLAPVLGFTGNATYNGKSAVKLQASATATQGTFSVNLCLLALGTTSTALQSNGGPSAKMAGCSIMSNSNATCNGHNLGATYGLAHGSDNGCGITEESNVPEVADPYAALASNIPKNTCASYSNENKHGVGGIDIAAGTWNLGATTQECGDVQLQGNVTINDTSGSAVLVIENGNLDLNGYTLTTASGSPVTIIFSGTNSGSYSHVPTGGGTLTITPPTSGTWSGVAIYQDPSLSDSNGGLDVSAAGNSPSWNITGLVYLPNSDVTLSGAVNKNATGSCFVMVMNDITINGTADIEKTGGCAAAGLSMPVGQVPGRGQLVL
jgi:Flp pilus assembly protein TadG